MAAFYVQSAGFFLSCFRLCGFDPPRPGSPFGMCLAGDPDDRSRLALHGAPREAPVCSQLAPGQVSDLAVAWRMNILHNPRSIPQTLLLNAPQNFQLHLCLLYKWVNLGDERQSSSQKSMNTFLLGISLN